ncbi:hypothetical protein ZIOFF_032548 [Zingiber officinale]|uniref:Reverse transcriptase Ty1/copia-type domain-containing protein n=1 Tax=Zingiber officinale TaxID=94328 RepID=A0A8J5GII1_ZINOF|nr:hypothetical protein ZIOFF_032548 [Zingiber officinale]
MFGEFKEVMTKEFEMTDIGLMAYYLGIEVNQREDGSFISQAGYAREILKKFRMDNTLSPYGAAASFPFQWGDYTGGYAIHLSSDITSFTSEGAGLLWMGWAGFNGGDPYSANIAVLNTNICAATNLLLVRTRLGVTFFKKPSVIGVVKGRA